MSLLLLKNALASDETAQELVIKNSHRILKSLHRQHRLIYSPEEQNTTTVSLQLLTLHIQALSLTF